MTRRRAVTSRVRVAPTGSEPSAKLVPVLESDLLNSLLHLENVRRLLSYVVERTTLSAVTSPLFLTVKRYVSSEFGAAGFCPEADACTAKLGL